jgi:hypothetical protein
MERCAGGRSGTPMETRAPCFGDQMGFKELNSVSDAFDWVVWKFRTPSGTGSSFRMNLPVSRPRSGIALAVASDRALATTTIVKLNVLIKAANTVIPRESHGKRLVFGQYQRRFLSLSLK